MSTELDKYLDDEKGSGKPGRPSWWHRRAMMTGALLFCGFCIIYSMIRGEDTSLAQSIVLSSFSLGGSIISVYIGARVWQDVNLKKIGAALESSKVKAGVPETTKAVATKPPKEFLTEE